MKVTGIRELRANSAAVLGSREPVLVTKHGKVAGVYVPLEDPKTIPEDLRKELVASPSSTMSRPGSELQPQRELDLALAVRR